VSNRSRPGVRGAPAALGGYNHTRPRFHWALDLRSDEGFRAQGKGANMATSQSQRLRRMAEKASRRKAVVAEKRRADTIMMGGREARQIIEAARSPIKTCVVADRLFADGIGWLVLARTLPSGLVGGSFFLVDVWCLGVKDAFFAINTPQKFADRMAASNEDESVVDINPSVARKLLHDAVAYAGSFGLAPSEGFAEAESIFGDMPLGTETFPFGRDGKPFYVSGPNDSPTRIRRILDTLVKCVGEGGFDYLVHVDDFA